MRDTSNTRDVDPRVGAADAEAAALDSAAVVVPVIEERISVGKHRVETGRLRVRIEVERDVETIATDLDGESYVSSIVASGTEVDERRAPYADGDDLVIPVYEERSVVVRRLFLKEEIRLSRVVRIEKSRQDIGLRRERAIVERLQPDGTWHEIEVARRLPTDLESK